MSWGDDSVGHQLGSGVKGRGIVFGDKNQSTADLQVSTRTSAPEGVKEEWPIRRRGGQ